MQRTSGLSVAALVVGIAGLCLLLLLGPLVVPVGIVAVILGVMGMRECDQKPDVTGRGMAIAGLVTGIIATVAGLVIVVFFLWIFQEIMNDVGLFVPL